MELILLIVVLVVVVAVAAFLIYFLKQKFGEMGLRNNNDQGFGLMQNQLNDLKQQNQNQVNELKEQITNHMRDTRDFNQRTHGNVTEMVQKQAMETNKIIRDVTEGLVKMNESNKQVLSFADQFKSFQDILKNPKQRGVLGEFYLENLLKNIFPPGAYKMQYDLGDNEIVDAVIFYSERLIPVDSKFSLENYNRLAEAKNDEDRARYEKDFRNDLKKRIDETAKYVKPEKGTMDFAFMFIPAEAIYYDLIVNQVGSRATDMRDLVEYAYRDKKVIIVSPTSFVAYLQTVLQGLRYEKMQKESGEIMGKVNDLGKHMKAYADFMISLGKHLGTTNSSYNKALREFGKVNKDVKRITGQDFELLEGATEVETDLAQIEG